MTATFNRGAINWLLRSVALVAVTFGLFAMHTLPSMASTPAMTSSDQRTTSGAASPDQPMIVAPATGCEGGHATCSAVLRSSHSIGVLQAGAELDRTLDLAGVALLATTRADGSRAPPRVCLTRLCISRT